MKVGLSGPAYNLSPGDEWEFPADEAMRLIKADFAVPVSEPKIERMVVDHKNTSIERRAGKKQEQ